MNLEALRQFLEQPCAKLGLRERLHRLFVARVLDDLLRRRRPKPAVGAQDQHAVVFGRDQQLAADFDLAIAALQHDVLKGAGPVRPTAKCDEQPSQTTHGIVGAFVHGKCVPRGSPKYLGTVGETRLSLPYQTAGDNRSEKDSKGGGSLGAGPRPVNAETPAGQATSCRSGCRERGPGKCRPPGLRPNSAT